MNNKMKLAGLILGAALLAQMMKKDKKEGDK